MLSKNKFYKFLSNYTPMIWEEFNENDRRFDLEKRYVNHALKNRYRFYITLKYALKHFLSNKMLILDLGTYPGTMLRILKDFLSDREFDLCGAGLCVSPEFVKSMEDKAGATIWTTNLDPGNEQLKNKNYTNTIPLKDEAADFIFALEIIEHLTSPVHMLKEACRVLKKGGNIIITTPNVTRIGSVFKLLAGRSNCDRLMPVDYYNEDDEWRPHFHEYDMKELSSLLGRYGFEITAKAFFNSTSRYYDVKTMQRRLIDLFKVPFFCVPHFRDNILVVAKKR